MYVIVEPGEVPFYTARRRSWTRVSASCGAKYEVLVGALLEANEKVHWKFRRRGVGYRTGERGRASAGGMAIGR